MKRLYSIVVLLLCVLAAQAQLSGTGFYRFRNAERTTDYISMTNDKFNFTTAIGTACGGLSQASSSAGQARALECVGKYLGTDIHMVQDADIVNPASVIYAKKKNTNSSNYDYNLIGQGTSILTLTTGTYPGSVQLEFQDRYVTINSVGGSGAQTLYTAKVELKSDTYVFLVGYPNLGTRYFVDNNGTFAINESSSATNAKWYIEPVTHFNVQPEVEFAGKYYATLYVPYAFMLSGQVEKAYVVTAIKDDGILETTKIASTGETVPAGTPVLLECSSNSAADCQLIPKDIPLFTAPDVSITANAPAADETTTNYTGTNILKGTYYCNTDGAMTFTTSSGTSSFNANHYTAITNKYVLGKNEDGKLKLVKATGTAMPANKAWIEYTGTEELVLPFEDTSVLLGDVNGDKDISIADVTALVNIILGKDNIEPYQYDHVAADVNQDKDISIADVTALVNIILGKPTN